MKLKDWLNEFVFQKLGFKVKLLSSFETLTKNEYWDGYWIKKRFVSFTCQFFGHPLHVHDYGSFQLSYFELFRDKVYHFKAATEKPVIIDCGANIGMSCIYFKMLYPQARITAIEADPAIFKLLQENVTHFTSSPVTCLNRAVYNKAGEKIIF